MFSDGAAGLLLLVLAAFVAAAAAVSEGDVLLAFRETLRGPVGDRPPAPLDQWVSSTGTGPCQEPVWYAVQCHPDTNQVLGLRLEYLSLQGAAPDMAPLAALLGLRVLSFANNNLTGAFPAGLSALPALKTLYLSRNRLAGDIPDGAFAAMRGLKKLFLGDNAFTGPIPGSITSPKLLVVQLARNSFQGPIPNFDQKGLLLFDVSDNQLSGPIPEVLSRFNAASFQVQVIISPGA
ncbi:pollen receptor-like kinase 5 [Triticum aestivum]|uniref:pollen receptor-like kinase 5 n=1 Tax=Triticum aestivum TaxID=4565 RepID=UPI001D00A650|nr:pollen receptor-like kinase 5 [Triticum aestivum]